MIKKLPHEYLRGVWEIVNESQENREELEFDIETLPVKKARELEGYVKNIFNNIETKKLKEVTNVIFSITKKQNVEMASDNESSFIIDSDDSWILKSVPILISLLFFANDICLVYYR